MKIRAALIATFLILTIYSPELVVWAVAPCCAQVSPAVEYVTPSANYYFASSPGIAYNQYTSAAYIASTKILAFNASSVTGSSSSSDGGIHVADSAYALNSTVVIGSGFPTFNFTEFNLKESLNYNLTATSGSLVELAVINATAPMSVWYDGTYLAEVGWATFNAASADSWTYNSSSIYNGGVILLKTSTLASRSVIISYTLPPPGGNGAAPPPGQVQITTVKVPSLQTEPVYLIIAKPFIDNPFLLVILALIPAAILALVPRRRRGSPQ